MRGLLIRSMNTRRQFPVIKGVGYALAHVPGLVEHGSKPQREIAKNPEVFSSIQSRLRNYEAALAYPPNRAYIGCLRPEALWDLEKPWWKHTEPAARFGKFGDFMPQAEFYGMMRFADEFNLVALESSFLASVHEQLSQHPLFDDNDRKRLGQGTTEAAITERIEKEDACPLRQDGKVVGCITRGHDEDPVLTADILLENLACKATGILALRSLFRTCASECKAGDVEYVINTGEEASGDRYQRGAGNLAKAMAELSGCENSTGGDLKAYCCSPIHSIVIAAGLVQSGVFRNVVVVGGGSLAKLGMKFRGHLTHDMPILEDILASFAIFIGPDDGRNPRIRLDGIGRQTVKDGGSAQGIAEAVVSRPLEQLGLKIPDIDRYAVELHNPEVTEPAGSGNVPRSNYRTIASLAVMKKEWTRERIADFERLHGLPGFSPTQGHVPSAVPYIGHAREAMLRGEMQRAMFIGKGSLFLGKMSNLSDGMSFVLEKQ
jgi:glycine/sarcosine/betaine reductase complex component C subunit beta